MIYVYLGKFHMTMYIHTILFLKDLLLIREAWMGYNILIMETNCESIVLFLVNTQGLCDKLIILCPEISDQFTHLLVDDQSKI